MHFLPLNPTYSTECAKACNDRNQPESLAIRKYGLPGEQLFTWVHRIAKNFSFFSFFFLLQHANEKW